MIYILCIIGLAYLISIGILIYGYRQLSTYALEKIDATTKFSIIIPFRNEADNLPSLLYTLQQLTYENSFYEIIFVDDDSDDDSVQIINEVLLKSSISKSFKIISNQRHTVSPKKDAITAAIAIAKYEWILTTDADCKLPEHWLTVYDEYIQKYQPFLLAGPVRYSGSDSFIDKFQLFDGISLQAVTMGSFGLRSPLMCNGANLAYKKEIFISVDGFTNNNHIASGDDIFILEKIRKLFPERVHFLKSEFAIVATKPQQNWPAVVSQRIRWASKTSKQKRRATILLGGLVFFSNLLVLVGFFYGMFQPSVLPIYFSYLVVKLLADYLFLKVSAKFFKREVQFTAFVINALLYSLIIVSVVFGSIRGSYTWKDRKFEKQS